MLDLDASDNDILCNEIQRLFAENPAYPWFTIDWDGPYLHRDEPEEHEGLRWRHPNHTHFTGNEFDRAYKKIYRGELAITRLADLILGKYGYGKRLPLKELIWCAHSMGWWLRKSLDEIHAPVA